MRVRILIISLVGFMINMAGNAQPLPDGSLRTFLDSAASRYPLLKARQYEMQAAALQAGSVNRQFGPELDAMYQANFSTYNNITGMNYPQLLLPISGPPSAGNNFNGVFGSAASVLFRWQAVTFGKKDAYIQEANTETALVSARQQQDLLSLQMQTGHAYLEALAAAALSSTFADNVRRTETDFVSIQALARSGLKPGVDTALMAAEISKARVGYLQSLQIRDQSLELLKQLLMADQLPALSDTQVLYRAPRPIQEGDTTVHPLLSYYDAAIQAHEAKKKSLEKSAAPSLGLWGTTYARGSGIDDLGNVKAFEGLGFQRFNYGAGAQFSIPILQRSRVKPLIEQQEWLLKSKDAERQEAGLQLQVSRNRAKIRLEQALLITDENMKLVKHAGYAWQAMRSRYESGLATISELLQAQYSLLKAETDSRISMVEAWKAALDFAGATGSMQGFINQIR